MITKAFTPFSGAKGFVIMKAGGQPAEVSRGMGPVPVSGAG